MVGAAEWQLVADGGMAYERELIFPHVAPAELERLGISGEVVTPYNALLIRLGGRVILVDAGLGGLAAAFGAPAGDPAATGPRPHSRALRGRGRRRKAAPLSDGHPPPRAPVRASDVDLARRRRPCRHDRDTSSAPRLRRRQGMHGRGVSSSPY